MFRDQTEGMDGQEGVVTDGVGAVGAVFGGVRAVAAVVVVLAPSGSDQAPTDRPTRSPPSSKPVIMLNAQSA